MPADQNEKNWKELSGPHNIRWQKPHEPCFGIGCRWRSDYAGSGILSPPDSPESQLCRKGDGEKG